MKIETGSFETSVPFYRSTRRHKEYRSLGFSFKPTKPPGEGSFSLLELFFKQISGGLYTTCTVCVFVHTKPLMTILIEFRGSYG